MYGITILVVNVEVGSKDVFGFFMFSSFGFCCRFSCRERFFLGRLRSRHRRVVDNHLFGGNFLSQPVVQYICTAEQEYENQYNNE